MSALDPIARQYSDSLEALSRVIVAEQAAIFAGVTSEIDDMEQALDWARAARHRYVLSHLQHRGLGPQTTEEAS